MLPTNSPTRMFFLPIFFVHANSHYAFSHKKIKKNNNITDDPLLIPQEILLQIQLQIQQQIKRLNLYLNQWMVNHY